jgi:hypothetical protein
MGAGEQVELELFAPELVMSYMDRSAETGGGSAPTRVSLLTNGVTWYLRSSLESDELGLRASTPRTFLGFLPIGTKRFDRRLDEVRGVTLGAKLFPERLLVAIGLALVAVFADLGTLGTVIVIVATVAMLLLSYIAVLRIEPTDGSRFVVPVCLAHLGRAKRFGAAATVRSETGGATEVP